MWNNTLRRITIQSLYTRLQFCISVIAKTQWQRPCFVLCAVYCILASVLLRVPPLKFPSLPISLPPTLPLAPLPHSVAPSLLRFLHPLFPSLRPCLRSFLTHSLPQPFLPSYTPLPPSLTASLHHSLPLLPLSPPSPGSFPPFLALSLPPSLPACLSPSNSMYTLCVFSMLNCIV